MMTTNASPSSEPSAAATVADAVLQALGSGQQAPAFSELRGGFDVGLAYAVTAELRRRREQRGERHAGRKIGFTNRQMWAEYGVHAPIWGDMYAGTVHDAPAAAFPLARLMDPKLEPEIAFGFARTPQAGMSDLELAGCLAWVAQAFEIVQSMFPGWRFAAADCIAAGGLHGALILGPRAPVEPDRAAWWCERLGDFEVTLLRNGEAVESGHARNVLDGPLPALRHFLQLLAGDAHNPPLATGEIVTTGSLTRALPVAPGERWSTRIVGIPVADLDVLFS